jgi:hypothetical protein
MQTFNFYDPKDKNENEQPIQRQENEEGLFLVNDDGTEMDTSERTYISVDLPEEEERADDSGMIFFCFNRIH